MFECTVVGSRIRNVRELRSLQTPKQGIQVGCNLPPHVLEDGFPTLYHDPPLHAANASLNAPAAHLNPGAPVQAIQSTSWHVCLYDMADWKLSQENRWACRSTVTGGGRSCRARRSRLATSSPSAGPPVRGHDLPHGQLRLLSTCTSYQLRLFGASQHHDSRENAGHTRRPHWAGGPTSRL